jgi:hypothetical protein
MSASRIAQDFSLSTASTVPPLGVSGMILLGYPVKDWAIALTVLYTLFMFAFGAWKWRREYLKARREDASE